MPLELSEQAVFQQEAQEVTDLIDTSVDVMNSVADFMKETRQHKDDVNTGLRALLFEAEVASLMEIMNDRSQEQKYCGLILQATRASLSMCLDGIRSLPDEMKAAKLLSISADMIRVSIFHLKAALEFTCGDHEKGNEMLEEGAKMANECAIRSQKTLESF